MFSQGQSGKQEETYPESFHGSCMNGNIYFGKATNKPKLCHCRSITSTMCSAIFMLAHTCVCTRVTAHATKRISLQPRSQRSGALKRNVVYVNITSIIRADTGVFTCTCLHTRHPQHSSSPTNTARLANSNTLAAPRNRDPETLPSTGEPLNYRKGWKTTVDDSN